MLQRPQPAILEPKPRLFQKSSDDRLRSGPGWGRIKNNKFKLRTIARKKTNDRSITPEQDGSEASESFGEENKAVTVSQLEIPDVEQPEYEPMSQQVFDRHLEALDYRSYARYEEPEFDFFRDRLKRN